MYTEYKLVAEKSGPKLVEVVNKYIRSGWKPQGGVATMDGYVMQAMIKEY